MAERTGRPLPTFSDDPVTDYLVAEAVLVKSGEQQKAEEEAREKANFRKDHRKMNETAGKADGVGT